MTKEWYVQCQKAKPSGWPEIWAYPQGHSWPPGWPRKYVGPEVIVHIEASESGEISFTCLDHYGEPSDAVEDEVFQIIAGTAERHSRLRPASEPDGPWYNGALVPIRKREDGSYGGSFHLEYDKKLAKGSRIVLEMSLYGFTQGPAANIGV